MKIKAGFFIFKNKGNQAIVALEESKKILLNNKDELQLADVYRELRQAKYTISKNKEAIEDLKRAEKIFLAYQNQRGLEKTYESIGVNQRRNCANVANSCQKNIRNVAYFRKTNFNNL